MNNSEFLDSVREIELELFSRDFNKWVKKQTEKDKKTCRSLRTEISTYRSQLETSRLRVLADKLEELSPSLTNGIEELQKEIDELNDFIATMETLGKIIGLVSRIVTLVA
jgi:gas vesicle protein